MLMPWNRDVAVVAAIIIFLFVMLPFLVKCLITHRTLTYVGKSHIRRGGGGAPGISPLPKEYLSSLSFSFCS